MFKSTKQIKNNYVYREIKQVNPEVLNWKWMKLQTIILWLITAKVDSSNELIRNNNTR